MHDVPTTAVEDDDVLTTASDLETSPRLEAEERLTNWQMLMRIMPGNRKARRVATAKVLKSKRAA